MVDAVPPTHEGATSRVWYLRTAAETAGKVHEQRVEYLPGSPLPPRHLHPDQDEYFEVEAGEMLFIIAGEGRLTGSGEVIEIPRGTPHQAHNASDTHPAVVRWETRPALRTGEFFTQAARLGGPKRLLDSALLAHEYRDVFRLCGPSARLIPVLATLARLRGRSLGGS